MTKYKYDVSLAPDKCIEKAGHVRLIEFLWDFFVKSDADGRNGAVSATSSSIKLTDFFSDNTIADSLAATEDLGFLVKLFQGNQKLRDEFGSKYSDYLDCIRNPSGGMVFSTKQALIDFVSKRQHKNLHVSFKLQDNIFPFEDWRGIGMEDEEGLCPVSEIDAYFEMLYSINSGGACSVYIEDLVYQDEPEQIYGLSVSFENLTTQSLRV